MLLHQLEIANGKAIQLNYCRIMCMLLPASSDLNSQADQAYEGVLNACRNSRRFGK